MKEKVRSPLQKALNVWAIVLIVWSVYRAYFKTDLPIWFDEFIAKPIVFILPVYYYITSIEKKPFLSSIDITKKNLLPTLLVGTAIGIIFFISGSLGVAFKSKQFFAPFMHISVSSVTLYYLVISLVTSISEEIISRGFILRRLYDDSRNMLSASLFSSILFFFLHVPILFTNDKIIGFILLRVMFTDLILSFAVSFIYLERRNLILPILIHAFYNLSLYLFI